MSILNMIATMGKERSKLYNHPECPCFKCMVKMTCTKSILDKTVCDEVKKFVIKIIDNMENKKS